MIINIYFVLLNTIFFLGLTSFLWKRRNRKESTVPPGPNWYSILIWLYTSYKKSVSPSTALKNLADIYGDVMTLNIGHMKAVIFSSHESINDILRSDYALDRAIVPLVKDRNMNKNLGLIWSNGENWDITRRFTLRHLRNFGYSKTQSMDSVINTECSKFISHFRHLMQQNAGVVNMDRAFNLPFLNNLWRFVIGKSYDYDDPEMQRLLTLQSEFFKNTNLIVDPVFPSWVRNWFPKWSGKSIQMECIENMYKFGQETLQEHKEYVKINSKPRGFLDVFVTQINKEGVSTAFTDDNCIMAVLDMLAAGADTSSFSLAFGILYMLSYPEIQVKVQQEIDSKLTKDESIILEMRDILPYTYATLLEIMRMGPVLHIPTPREATQDFICHNYLIKKGTLVITNVFASHFNVKTWSDPENFRPERFLNKDGTQVDTKVEELLNTFGGGKRVCIGQSVAEASLFIFFVSLLREFQFVQVEGMEPPSLEPVPGAVYTPRPCHVKVIERLIKRE